MVNSLCWAVRENSQWWAGRLFPALLYQKPVIDLSHDKEIEAYRKQREQIDKVMSDGDADSVINEIMQLQMSIEEAKAKLKLE